MMVKKMVFRFLLVLFCAKTTAAFILSTNKISELPYHSSRKLLSRNFAHQPINRNTTPKMIDVGTLMFDIDRIADTFVSMQLKHLTPISALALYGAGVATSLSPCALSVLPLTVGYISGSQKEGKSAVLPSVAFSLGLASVLTLMGLAAASFGSVYGSLGEGPIASILPLIVSSLFIFMGLAMLDVLPLPPLPTWKLEGTEKMGQFGRAFMFGASSALASSPCATPVLASLLAYVAESGDPVLGAGLLLAYTAGYSTPVVAAGTAAGWAGRLAGLKRGAATGWVTAGGGALLVYCGTYSALARLLPG